MLPFPEVSLIWKTELIPVLTCVLESLIVVYYKSIFQFNLTGNLSNHLFFPQELFKTTSRHLYMPSSLVHLWTILSASRLLLGGLLYPYIHTFSLLWPRFSVSCSRVANSTAHPKQHHFMYGGGLVTHPVVGPGNDQVVSQRAILKIRFMRATLKQMWSRNWYISSNFSNLIN